MINYIMEFTPKVSGAGLETNELYYPDELTAKCCFYESIIQLRWAKSGKLFSVNKDGQRTLICEWYR